MRKCYIILAAVVAALAITPLANAWHANGVTLSVSTPPCGQARVVSATIDQSSQWPGATVKTITPSSFAADVVGVKTVVVVIGWANSNDKQTFTKTVTLASNVCPPTPPKCPEGYVEAGKSEGVLLCTKETRVEVPFPVEVVRVEYRDVPGPTVERIVTVDRVVEKLVPGATVIKTVKVKGKTKYVYRTKIITKVKRSTVYKNCPVQGAG